MLTAPIELGGYELPAGAGRAVHLPHPPPPRRLPRAGAVQARAFPRRRPPDTYSWIPFGGGIRRCLGASFAIYEMKVVIPAMLRGVRLRAVGDRAGADPPPRDHVRARARRAVVVERCASGGPRSPRHGTGRRHRPSSSLRRSWPAARTSPRRRQTVAVIGGTGALGFGLGAALGDRRNADRDRLPRRRPRGGGGREGRGARARGRRERRRVSRALRTRKPPGAPTPCCSRCRSAPSPRTSTTCATRSSRRPC